MGMAASQARFLGLTARKTNTEYEGQQVNQQRTALANESGGLFNQMLALQVPTPPSATDFYNIRYTYTAGGNGFEITNYSSSTSGAGYAVTVRESVDAQIAYATTKVGTLDKTAQTFAGFPLTLVNNQDLAKEVNKSNINFYQYTNANSETLYINQEDYNNYTDPYTGGILQYGYKDGQRTTQKTIDPAFFDVDDNGRFSAIHYTDPALGSVEQKLEMAQVMDDSGYDKAMNDYYYQKMMYERSITDINARTEIIQNQDRTLELRLKQLDTEQEALQTEMDAVKKVIDKNVEMTFKTFA